jgi:hypothetical protein
VATGISRVCGGLGSCGAFIAHPFSFVGAAFFIMRNVHGVHGGGRAVHAGVHGNVTGVHGGQGCGHRFVHGRGYVDRGFCDPFDPCFGVHFGRHLDAYN